MYMLSNVSIVNRGLRSPKYVCCSLVQIIRILEKLAPKQAHLFSSAAVCTSAPAAGISNRCETELSKSIQPAESSGDVVTTAFPFLLQSEVATDC